MKYLVSYETFSVLNEGKLDPKPYDPKYASKIAALASYINNQIEQIAKDLATERHLNDPRNYPNIEVGEVDRSRALRMIFKKEWKKKLKAGQGDQFIINARIDAKKKDDKVRRKNHRLALKLEKDFYEEDRTPKEDTENNKAE